MFKSKLKPAYPVAVPALYIIGKWEELDPIFAGRLAKMAKDYRAQIKLTEGYRSSARQAELYRQYQEYRRTGKGSIKLAAKPGTSWHEFRLAIDTSTQPIRGMPSIQLQKYGLCKPIKSEPWHIQPIETAGQKDYKNWEPIWQEEEMVTETKIMVDGKIKTVKRILKDGENYIRLRDMDDVLGVVKVEYDEANKVAVVTD